MSYKATKPGLVSVLYLSMRYMVLFIMAPFYVLLGVSLNHDRSDGTGIQSVSPVPSAPVAGPSVPSVSNSRSN